jgi:hypothetical protein
VRTFIEFPIPGSTPRCTARLESRPDVDSTDASSGDETKEAARSGKANEFLRWPNTAKRRPLQQFPG